MYCEIVPYNHFPEDASDVKGVILSGSPYAVMVAFAIFIFFPVYAMVYKLRGGKSPVAPATYVLCD
jgi:hypothetical protein